MEAAPALDGRVRVGLNLFRVRDVGGDRVGGAADGAGRRFDCLAVHVDAGDPRPLLGEPDRGCPADSGARAGDDRHLAGQSVAHRPPPVTGPPDGPIVARECATG